MGEERDDYMRRQEADHDLLRMRTQAPPAAIQGCVCPIGAEATCKGPLCPRQKWVVT